MDKELLQDSDGVNESFWDGLGVEFEAKYIFDFRSAPRGPGPAPRGPGSARDRGQNSVPGGSGRSLFSSLLLFASLLRLVFSRFDMHC